MPAMDDPDVELMLQVQQGDLVAFESLIDRYKQPIYNMIFRMLRDANEDSGNSGINVSSIANILDAPRRTIRRRLSNMEALGWISIEKMKSETRIEITQLAIKFLDDWIAESIAANAKEIQRILEI